MKKIFLLMLVGIVLASAFLTVIWWTYRLNNFSEKESEKFCVESSDGTKFKMIYTLHDFPDESYSIDVIGKSNDKTTIFGGDGVGSKDVKVEFICKQGSYTYYNAVLQYNKEKHEVLFICSESEKLSIVTDGSYIESYSDMVVFSNWQDDYSYEVFTPVAKTQILNNQGDYILAYAEVLIQDGEEVILKKLNYFVNNPTEIQCRFYDKDKIIETCYELLQKYGNSMGS